jgi:ABC-type Fe3+-hydroxamate transport system substrate-binding protein
MKSAFTYGLSSFIIVVFSFLSILIATSSGSQDREPIRIVSLAPNITREIYDLGAQSLLIGVTSYSPVKADSGKQLVGSPMRINIEKTYSLRPQLVLASTDCNSKADIETLKKLGCKVHVFSGCESFACMCVTFKELGVMLGRSRRAEDIIGEVRAQMDIIQAKIHGRKSLKVFWQLGENPIVTASDATFSGELLRSAGCVNIFGNAPMRYPRVNAEEVIKRNPDVIVVVSQMGSGSTGSVWGRFGTISAVNKNRVYDLSADMVCQPTPLMYLKGYKAVLALLYPGIL